MYRFSIASLPALTVRQGLWRFLNHLGLILVPVWFVGTEQAGLGLTSWDVTPNQLKEVGIPGKGGWVNPFPGAWNYKFYRAQGKNLLNFFWPGNWEPLAGKGRIFSHFTHSDGLDFSRENPPREGNYPKGLIWEKQFGTERKGFAKPSVLMGGSHLKRETQHFRFLTENSWGIAGKLKKNQGLGPKIGF